MRRTAADAEATRRAILAAARASFAEHGFAAASTTAIAAAAGVTRGALYHHFAGKTDLFRAVFVEIEHELNDYGPCRRLAETGSLYAFVAGCAAWLDFAVRPDYQRIAVVDAPAVLGAVEWHDIDAGIGLASMEAGPRALAATGFSSGRPSRALAVLLFGALTDAGLVLARGDGAVEAGPARRLRRPRQTGDARSAKPPPQFVDLGVEGVEISRVVDHPVGPGGRSSRPFCLATRSRRPSRSAPLSDDPIDGDIYRRVDDDHRVELDRPGSTSQQRGVDDHDVIGTGLGGDASADLGADQRVDDVVEVSQGGIVGEGDRRQRRPIIFEPAVGTDDGGTKSLGEAVEQRASRPLQLADDGVGVDDERTPLGEALGDRGLAGSDAPSEGDHDHAAVSRRGGLLRRLLGGHCLGVARGLARGRITAWVTLGVGRGDGLALGRLDGLALGRLDSLGGRRRDGLALGRLDGLALGRLDSLGGRRRVRPRPRACPPASASGVPSP